MAADKDAAHGGAAEAGARRTWRRDYRVPEFAIDQVDLRFDLALPVTRVTARLEVRRIGADTATLVLNGERLKLLAVRLDGAAVPDHLMKRDDRTLTLLESPARFALELVTEVTPADNPGLEGLVYADGYVFSHCEPEGFRRITYFPDRPDVLAPYACTVVADPGAFPTLLSNGDLVESGALPDGRHFARWVDPIPKASYLFALAAGPFGQLADEFTTASGRKVALAVHAPPDDLPFCGFGMQALKHAMAWDEIAFGREYDLARLNVAVFRGYPGGAMECKGLNLYTSEVFLAAPAISTDPMLRMTEAVVAHEYFHNWSGNRVGCRDWFELSLKEGLTIYRQQRYLEHVEGAAVSRISDVERLKEFQFPEEDGAMAHAVRPKSYLAINNFYTPTVYEKGAELIRMMNTIVGDAAFAQAMQAFFTRFDGKAVTIDALIDTVESASGQSLALFRPWYDAERPVVIVVTEAYDEHAQLYSLTFRQVRSAPDPDEPLHVPLRMGLLDSQGEPIPLQLASEPEAFETERVFQLGRPVETLTFRNIGSRPTPSLFRGFSAHVRVAHDLDAEHLARIARFDTDPVNRWDAGQRLARLASLGDEAASDAWLEMFAGVLSEARSDPALAGRRMQLPTERRLAQDEACPDLDAIRAGRRRLAGEVVRRFRSALRSARLQLASEAAMPDGVHARRLRNQALWYLFRDPQKQDLASAWSQWRDAAILEDEVAALRLLIERDGPVRALALEQAYERWRTSPSMLDRWFVTQAESDGGDSARLVAGFLDRPDFALDNVARVKATFDAFTFNQGGLHDPDGLGYR